MIRGGVKISQHDRTAINADILGFLVTLVLCSQTHLDGCVLLFNVQRLVVHDQLVDD